MFLLGATRFDATHNLGMPLGNIPTGNLYVTMAILPLTVLVWACGSWWTRIGGVDQQLDELAYASAEHEATKMLIEEDMRITEFQLEETERDLASKVQDIKQLEESQMPVFRKIEEARRMREEFDATLAKHESQREVLYDLVRRLVKLEGETHLAMKRLDLASERAAALRRDLWWLIPLIGACATCSYHGFRLWYLRDQAPRDKNAVNTDVNPMK